MLKRLLFLVMMFVATPFIGASEHQRGATLKEQVKAKLGYAATSLPGQIIVGTGIGGINGALWGKAFHGVSNAYDRAEDMLQKTGRKRLLTASRIGAGSLLLSSPPLLAFPMVVGAVSMTHLYQVGLKKSGIIDKEEDMTTTMMIPMLFAMPATFLKFAFKCLK